MKTDLLVLGISMFLLSIFLVTIGLISESIEAPCVDGDGDINLEGIMCDKNIYYIFGFEQESFKGGLILGILGFLIIGGFLLILGGYLYDEKKTRRKL